MVKRIDAGGNTLGSFRITVSNQLLGLQVTGLSNKVAQLEIYLAPKTNQTGATYTSLNPQFNVLQRATGANIGTVSFTGATLIENATFNAGNQVIPINYDVSDSNFLLDNQSIGIIVLVNSATVTDFEMILRTQDLF